MTSSSGQVGVERPEICGSTVICRHLFALIGGKLSDISILRFGADEACENLSGVQLIRSKSSDLPRVFRNARGTAPLLNPRYGWDDVIDRADRAGFRWHDLRHTFSIQSVMARSRSPKPLTVVRPPNDADGMQVCSSEHVS